MSVFTKRNALVGFLTLNAASRMLRRRRRRNGARIVLLVMLGLVSLGLLACLAIVVRRQLGGAQPEEAAGEEEQASGPETVPATPMPEPVPAA